MHINVFAVAVSGQFHSWRDRDISSRPRDAGMLMSALTDVDAKLTRDTVVGSQDRDSAEIYGHRGTKTKA